MSARELRGAAGRRPGVCGRAQAARVLLRCIARREHPRRSAEGAARACVGSEIETGVLRARKLNHPRFSRRGTRVGFLGGQKGFV